MGQNKWRVGKWGSCVVRDFNDNDEMGMSYIGRHAFTSHYGGYLIAESIEDKNLPLIAAAPELQSMLEMVADFLCWEPSMKTPKISFSLMMRSLELLHRSGMSPYWNTYYKIAHGHKQPMQKCICAPVLPQSVLALISHAKSIYGSSHISTAIIDNQYSIIITPFDQ